MVVVVVVFKFINFPYENILVVSHGIDLSSYPAVNEVVNNKGGVHVRQNQSDSIGLM